MFLGRIDGNVWATIKDEKLKGIRLYIMQPIDENEDPQGAPLIAVDTVGVQEGDLVYWVNSTEAGYIRSDFVIPSETTIVGLVERIDLDKAALNPEVEA